LYPIFPIQNRQTSSCEELFEVVYRLEARSGFMSQPDFLGRYQLGREIGRGFSSIVYEATDIRRGRTVAMKVLTLLQIPLKRRREMAERFEREARAISALSHPAIVAVYDVGQTEEGEEFLVMERLQGETLRARLDRTGPLLRAEALPLMVQIADALQYAHGRGIIHRDVKPDNIFLCADGTAKLMDFGVAHVFADEGLTQTGTIVGSPAYMSPEQINGVTLDGRTDVFSLAVTLVEILTGRKPFEGPNIPAVLNRILNQPPQMAGIGAPALHKALERALAKAPLARTASAGAFAEAMRRVQPFPSVGAHTITGTQVMLRPDLHRTHSFGSQKTAALGIVGLGILTLCALAIGLRHPDPAPVSFHATVHRVQAIASVPPARIAPMVTMPLPHPLQTQDSTSTKITEHVPTPMASPPLTLGTLNALRNEPPPQPALQVMPSDPSLAQPSLAQPSSTPDIPPQLAQQPSPVVPPSTPAQSLPAAVGLLVSVNPQGEVSHARVTQSSGDANLDAAAIADVLTWQYTPASCAGHPVPADVMTQVSFSR
jgi:TonB family protein